MGKIKSVKAKQLVVFSTMIIFIVVMFGGIFYRMKQFATNRIYNHLEMQAEYYMNSLDYRLEQIMEREAEFFASRQLSFLADEQMLDDYDRREALLSVQEKISVLKSSDELISEVVLYVPNSRRVITPNAFLPLDYKRELELQTIISNLGTICTQKGDINISLSEAPYTAVYPPHFYVNLVLNQEKFVESLNGFVLPEGGACWYNEKYNWFVEDSGKLGIGQEILAKTDLSNRIQKIKIDNTTYLVCVTTSDYFGNLVQYCSQSVVLEELDNYTFVFVLFVFMCIVCSIVFSKYTERLVNQPLKKLYEAFERLKVGDMNSRISHSTQDEFQFIYDGYNHAVDELSRMIDEVYVQKQQVAQAELKQLQAQINPHFLYNTFFLLKCRVEREDIIGASELADYLGRYFMYITRNKYDSLKLLDEISHAEVYARIQESRFISRINLIWEELPIEYENIQVPRLIIQPILENAYKYGLEDREDSGLLHLYYIREGNILQICIANNGNITDEVVDTIKKKLSEDYCGEITGIVNIHRRLKRFFGIKSGIQIEKDMNSHMIVKVCIPLEEEEDVSTIDRR